MEIFSVTRNFVLIWSEFIVLKLLLFTAVFPNLFEVITPKIPFCNYQLPH